MDNKKAPREVMVFGHRNPDTDSLVSAVALSELKKSMGIAAKAYRLGEVGKESHYVFETWGVEIPPLLADVKTQVSDVHYHRPEAVKPGDSIYTVFSRMQAGRDQVLAMVDDEDKLLGIVTLRDIAVKLLEGDIYSLRSSPQHIQEVLQAKALVNTKAQFQGQLCVIAYYSKNKKLKSIVHEGSIVLVGDRYDVIEQAIANRAELILVTGGHTLPESLIAFAEKKGVSIFSSPWDTYTVSQRILLCNDVQSVAMTKKLKSFVESAYLDVAVEEMQRSNHSTYPVVDKDYRYRGFLSRRHLIGAKGKPVVLVDHNERAQSALGIEEADVLEIVDHHKIGDIATSLPIRFRNEVVGSTSTIVYGLYKEAGIRPPKRIAGLLQSGIISDTLYLKSPTSTRLDASYLQELEEISGIASDEHARAMFKAGTSLEGLSIEEILLRDYKIFQVSGKILGIGQVYTLDIERIIEKKEKILDWIKTHRKEQKEYLCMLVVTDLVAGGSYLFYDCLRDDILALTFERPVEQGDFIPGILSRKKQIVPPMMNTIMHL